MARWNIECALEIIRLMESRWPDRWAALRERLALTPEEAALWREVGAGLVSGFDSSSGLIEQFAGFFQLEPISVASYPCRTAPMDVLLGPERTQRSQVIKQPDVVMLLALLGDRFSREVQEANFRYYEGRCGHGSSLSPAIHAVVAARLGDMARAERYFRQAAAIDLDDMMGNESLGVHIGALGGLWQAAVFGFGGLSICTDGIRLNPHLPSWCRALRFRIRWRGRQLHVHLRSERPTLVVTLERGEPMNLYVAQTCHGLQPASPWTLGE